MKTEMIRVYGIVQGVGFRPFVSREASDLGLCGTVANKGSYVEIHAQGSEKAVEELKKALENRPPERLYSESPLDLINQGKFSGYQRNFGQVQYIKYFSHRFLPYWQEDLLCKWFCLNHFRL